MTQRFTAIIEHDDDTYVAFCPEFHIESQREFVSDPRNNLREAIELSLEPASPDEIQSHLLYEGYFTQLEVAVGSSKSPLRRKGLQIPESNGFPKGIPGRALTYPYS